MRVVRLLGVFLLVAVAAFSLAISGLGEIGNALLFLATAVALLLAPAHLTSARPRIAAPGSEAPQESGGGQV